MKYLMKKGRLNRDFESNVESLEQLTGLFYNAVCKFKIFKRGRNFKNQCQTFIEQYITLHAQYHLTIDNNNIFVSQDDV